MTTKTTKAPKAKTKTFRFRLGDHGLAQKGGHCSACSAVEAVITVQAEDLDEALKLANRAVKWDAEFRNAGTHTFPFPGTAGDGVAEVSFSIQGTITKRQLIKEA